MSVGQMGTTQATARLKATAALSKNQIEATLRTVIKGVGLYMILKPTGPMEYDKAAGMYTIVCRHEDPGGLKYALARLRSQAKFQLQKEPFKCLYKEVNGYRVQVTWDPRTFVVSVLRA